jgi:hypothetical protein
MKRITAEFKRAAADCRSFVEQVDALDDDDLEGEEFLEAVIEAASAGDALGRHLQDSVLFQIDAVLDSAHDARIQERRHVIAGLLGQLEETSEEAEGEPDQQDETSEGDEDEQGENLRELLSNLEDSGAIARQIASHLDYIATYLEARASGSSDGGSTHNYHGPVITGSTLGSVAVGKHSRAEGTVTFNRVDGAGVGKKRRPKSGSR